MDAILYVLTAVMIVIVVYLLLIMPRVLGRPGTDVFRQELYAHRGLHDNSGAAPENSIEAFRRAVDAGYGIELDIRLTKDEMVVVFHDDTLKRMCGAEGRVCDFTYEELQQFTLGKSTEKIPLFTDVLQIVDGKVPLIVEFKMNHWEPKLCRIGDEILQKYQGAYCMESFHPLCVAWYRRHRKDVVRGVLAQKFGKEGFYKGMHYFLLQNLLLNFLAKPDFIAYNHKHRENISRKLCSSLFGAVPVAWTIRSEAEMAEARKYFSVLIFDSFNPVIKSVDRS